MAGPRSGRMRTALVTGASGGIGRATANALAADHNIVVHYHSNEAAAAETAALVREAGGEALTVGCDLSEPAASEDLVADATERFGGVDVLVNNAGVIHREPLETATDEVIRETIDVNLTGAVHTTRAVLPGLLERGGGHVVMVSSSAGIHGSPTDPVYGAAKAGMVGLMKSLARQHTPAGVFCNVVAPTATDTRMYPEAARPSARESIPIGRLIKPEEVAEAIRFVATTSSVSGKVLEVDAGRYT